MIDYKSLMIVFEMIIEAPTQQDLFKHPLLNQLISGWFKTCGEKQIRIVLNDDKEKAYHELLNTHGISSYQVWNINPLNTYN